MIHESKYITVLAGQNMYTSISRCDLGLPSSFDMIPYPSDVHLCLKALLKKGVIKHIVTSNQDSLFQLMELEPENLTEIYGNVCTEQCMTCKTMYHRHFVVKSGDSTRLCEKSGCDGKLIHVPEIKIGDKLDERYLKGFHEVMKSDMLLCLGAFYTKPFATFTHQLKENNEHAKIAICHSKKSFREMDDFARRGGVRIYEHVENFLRVICGKLLIEIPRFVYEKEKYIYSHQIREAIPEKGIFDSVSTQEGLDDIVAKIKETQSLVKPRSSIDIKSRSTPDVTKTSE